MKFLQPLLIAIALAAAAAHAGESFQAAVHAPVPTHPSRYSFADVYRLTVSGAAPAGFPALATESPIRVAVTQAAPPAEAQFSINAVAEPQRWLLFLSGLALAAWVARRRLGYAY